jgi:hypothetical protein
MAHPALGRGFHMPEEIGVVVDDQFGKTVLPLVGPLNISTKDTDHDLKTITDSENGNTQVEHPRFDFWAVGFVNAGGASGKYDPFGSVFRYIVTG